MSELDQNATPYADAIARYADHHPVRLHLPGHGGDTAGTTILTEYFGGRLADLDIMPMVEGIDLGPDNPYQQSLALAADAWGARRTWFLTNGASQGNLIAILATRSFGDVTVVQRSVHSSMIDAFGLSGGRARFVAPVVDHEHGVAHGVRADDIAAELDACAARGETVGAVVVVSPSYFGFVSDIAAIAAVVHDHDVPLIVDEAWGAHLGFHPGLPQGALALGADLVVSSTHKLGGSLTQSAMLHLGHGPFADRLETAIDGVYRSVQSTSESALLLVSLDLARHALATGRADIGASLAAADRITDAIRSAGRFGILSDRFADVPGWGATDRLRVVIDTQVAGLDGRVARTTMFREHGLLVELATEGTLVAVIGAGAVPDSDALPCVLASLPDADALPPHRQPPLPPWGTERLSIRDAWLGPSETVPAAEAVGRISAASLAAYPPGIPNLLPGEEITAEVVDFLRAVAASPAGHVRGAHDPAVDHLRVVS